jgi:hypothetical protein
MKGLEEEMGRILSKGEWISLFDISDMTGATVLTLRRMISRFNVEKIAVRKFNVEGKFYRLRKLPADQEKK